MIKLGLTGSIAMGKSTIAAMFERCGVPIHDSDAAARKALEPDSPVFKIAAQLFPESWDRQNFRIDRAKLARIVFDDPAKKQQLEEIVHPFIWQQQAEFTQHHQRLGTPVIVFDIPLLFETGSAHRFDYIIVATAPAFLQRKRALSRPGMSLEKFEAINSAQMPDAEKRAHADFIVHTGLGRGFAMRRVKSILAEITDKSGKRCVK